MIRKAFLIRAKEGMLEEYIKRHNPVWPELARHYKASGVSNFSIFLDRTTGFLFGYLEVEEEEGYNRIGEAEVCRLWWKYMAEVLVCEHEEDNKGKEVILEEIFYLR